MKLSTKGRYGTRALLELALNEEKDPVLLREIAARQDIPLSYLEHVISPLVAAGIVRSIKGPKGGVVLARKPADIVLSDVMQTLEGSLAPAECVDNPDSCERSASCVSREIWVKLRDVMNEVLGSTTLQDLVDRQKDKGSLEAMYYI